MPHPFWAPFWGPFWRPFWHPIKTGSPSGVEKPCTEGVSDVPFSTRQRGALRERMESALVGWRPVASGVVSGIASGVVSWGRA